MQIFKKIKISYYTYLFFLIGFFCGYLKNLLIIFIICFIHELGHAFFIKLFKYEIVKIEILPFGGYTLINKRINEPFFEGSWNQNLQEWINHYWKQSISEKTN